MKSTPAADCVLTAETRARIAGGIKSSGIRIGADRVMLTALVLALHADRDGKAYPSRTTLESLTGVPARLIRQAIDVLESAGVVEVIREPGRHNVYVFPDPAGIPTPQPGRELGRDADPTRQGTRQGTGQGCLPQREVKLEVEGVRSRYCTKHPTGTDEPCRGCMLARESYEAWEAAQRTEREASVMCPHGIPRGDWLDRDGVSTGGCLACESLPPASHHDVQSLIGAIGRRPA